MNDKCFRAETPSALTVASLGVLGTVSLAGMGVQRVRPELLQRGQQAVRQVQQLRVGAVYSGLLRCTDSSATADESCQIQGFHVCQHLGWHHAGVFRFSEGKGGGGGGAGVGVGVPSGRGLPRVCVLSSASAGADRQLLP